MMYISLSALLVFLNNLSGVNSARRASLDTGAIISFIPFCLIFSATKLKKICQKRLSDTINVSAVETEALEVNEELVEQSLNQIRECIINGNPEDITVETNITTTGLTFKDISPEQASAIINLLRNNDESELSDILVFSDLKVSVKAKEAKELIQEVEEYNEGVKQQYLEDTQLDSEIKFDESKLRTIQFKGLSIKNNYYPRFS